MLFAICDTGARHVSWRDTGQLRCRRVHVRCCQGRGTGTGACAGCSLLRCRRVHVRCRKGHVPQRDADACAALDDCTHTEATAGGAAGSCAGAA